ncbi:MAG: hypothetical protein AAF441_25135 [Pseudomonadota bacterium]
MADTITLRKISGVPDPGSEFRLVRAQVSGRGTGLFLFGQSRLAASRRGHTAPNLGLFEKTRLQARNRLCVVECSGAGTNTTMLAGRKSAEPLIDVTRNGQLVLIDEDQMAGNYRDYGDTLAVLGPDGNELRRFPVGEGPCDLAVDEHDRIWISYFPEWDYGAPLDGNPQVDGSGQSSENCFDLDGKLIWQRGIERDDHGYPVCSDVLNVGATMIFADRQRCWSCDAETKQITGMDGLESSCEALAWGHTHSLAAGTCNCRTGLLYRSASGQIEPPNRVDLRLEDGETDSTGNFYARGSVLHYISRAGWYRLDINALE